MKRVKRRGVTEIKIGLLPDRAKRDYVLRLVSSIIVMAFLIINFFYVFLPRTNLISDINTINKRIYSLRAVHNNILEVFQMNDNNIYDVNENNNLNKIDVNSIDIIEILDTLNTLRPVHSYTETISYDQETHQFLIQIQADSLIDLTTYKSNILSIEYVTSVDNSEFMEVSVPDGENRYKTIYKIIINAELAPRVGDENE